MPLEQNRQNIHITFPPKWLSSSKDFPDKTFNYFITQCSLLFLLILRLNPSFFFLTRRCRPLQKGDTTHGQTQQHFLIPVITACKHLMLKLWHIAHQHMNNGDCGSKEQQSNKDSMLSEETQKWLQRENNCYQHSKIRGNVILRPWIIFYAWITNLPQNKQLHSTENLTLFPP